MSTSGAGMRLGFIEPHLRCFGGIRRMVEFANRLVARGHHVVFYLPDGEDLSCTWMRCEADIRPVASGFDDELDVILYNHEPHWHLLDRFTRARSRVFYALHYGRLYGKEGSWESIRAPVDLQLANSGWTADQIAAETGHRPTVQLGGVNREMFHPWPGEKRYPLLCTGEEHRPWKGTETIHEAGRLLDVPVATYAGKGLDQVELGRTYASAQVFAVGSWFEGFCQPGVEALGCGVPLVTTDNGGCREYAIDGETALVVPPRDPRAMADAIRRLLDDGAFAAELVTKGLDLVERDFDWERRTDEFAELLDGVAAGAASSPPPPRPEAPAEPELSVVVLAWDNLRFSQLFVESVRQHTSVPYELIIVDNGSAWEAANYARLAGDHTVLNDENLGFAKGMNQGLALAKGRFVAFCNNDTILPEGWAAKLLETARAYPKAGIVVPAITNARNAATVRSEPGDFVGPLAPFSAPPAAVIYVMPTDVVRELGSWGQEYEIASGEDVDLAFKVWVNDLDIVFDERVLVDHIGKGSASRLDNWQDLWIRNRERFLAKWTGEDEIPRLSTLDLERFTRNRATARSAAQWMGRYFSLRDGQSDGGRVSVAPVEGVIGARLERRARRLWKRIAAHLPAGVNRLVRRVARKAIDVLM